MFCSATLFGGGKRDRTADLLHAMQALSQLSYTPDAAEQKQDYRGYIVRCKAPRLSSLQLHSGAA
jgi:hypothetical protein